MSHPSNSLLHAAQDGDPNAFEQFVTMTVGDVTRYCRFLGEPGHVDDLVQETYTRALRSLHTFRGDSSALHWLITIARRSCAEAIQQQHRARRPEITRRTQSDAHAGVEIELLIDALPHDQRQAFVLTQLLGYTYEDTAELCACPIGTIRSRVARARDTLATTIERAHQAS